MRNKKIALLTSSLTFLTAGLLALNLAGNSSMQAFQLKSTSYGNSVSIIRTSGFDGDFTGISSVTATTEKGNSLEFGANHFDVRNNYGTAWNDCLVFCTTKGQSTLWNKTELYGITSIKIYSYDYNNPDSYASLSSASFTFYYGYEMIDFDDEYYVAKQTTTSGKIEFAAGYEPSFFGIKCNTDYDLCISKVEVNYQCVQISGELVTYDEAQGYNPKGKVFEYTNGNSVVTREVEMAPLAHEYLALENRVNSWNSASYYEPSTHSWTTTRDDYLQIRRSDDSAFSARTGRDTVLITLKVSKAEGFTGWNGNSDIYLRVNHAKTGVITNRIALHNPYNTDSWAIRASGFEIYDAETGATVTGNWWDKKVTIEFDVSSSDTILNVGLGTSNAYQTFTVYDISFRKDCDNDNHEVLDAVSTGYSFGHRCHRCLKFVDQYVELEYRNFSGKPDSNFTYETGVSFGGFNNCLKTTANIRTNTVEGGYYQNYQLRLNGLIANARAAGLTYIRFKGYVQSASNFNSRFAWGFATGTTINSCAIIDHYNGPTSAYSSLAADCIVSVTKLDGTHAGASGGQTNSALANQWFIMTMDVSDSAFEGKELFFSPAHTFDEGTYPMHIYVADLECLSSL